jgi:transposase
VLVHEEVFMIHQLKRDGLTVRAIAQRTGLDRKTVRKYLALGIEAPVYGPRAPQASVLDEYRDYLRHRLDSYPELTAVRLCREIQALGYAGSYSGVKRFIADLRPARDHGFEHRFETPPGHQAQVDFAHFQARFSSEPDLVRTIWLFSMVLGHSRYLFCRFVLRQDMPAVVRCHLAAFAALGGVPREILYDRMKTAVLGAGDDGHIVYNRQLLDLARHFGFIPRACAAYRAKTKGKVERPFRYIRQDFFLGRQFRDLDDLNAQLDHWLGTVANVRQHGTTGRIVGEAFAAERPHLEPLPAVPFSAVLRVERRVSRDGMVSVDGNEYSVPDLTRRRIVEVQITAQEILILEEGRLVAVHPVLPGRRQRRVAAGHRSQRQPSNAKRPRQDDLWTVVERPGDHVGRRPLEIYDQVAGALAAHKRRTACL